MLKNNNAEIITIYGKAGCGKTTTLSKIITADTDEFVVLAPTNSAVDTIFKMCSKEVNKLNRSLFKTIYSFFRIDYHNDIVLGAIEMPNTIYIDEFSLIDKFLFKKCMNDMISKGCKKIVLCGDVMQLNAIYKTKQYISFGKINKWNLVYQKIISNMNSDKYTPNIYPKVLEHIHLNIFGLKIIQNGKLINLNVNKRSNDVVKNILSNIYAKNYDFNYSFLNFFDVPNYILNLNYVFIASKYSILQKIYDYIYDIFWRKSKLHEDIITLEQHISFSSGFKNLYLYPGMKIIVCDTDEHKKYINGEELIFTGNFEYGKMKCLKMEEKEYIYVNKIKEVDKTKSEEYYPICPSFLMTIHKSQGKTIDNVIVCIDDMFDMSMMYTAITRAKNNLVFFSKVNDDKERRNILIKNAYIEEFKQLNLICNNVSNE